MKPNRSVGSRQSLNVVLYEQLVDGDDSPGVSGDELVQEQVETHTWNNEEHSKVHLGELHWGTNPNDRQDDADQQTRLVVEVGYVEGRNPRDVKRNNLTVLEAAEENFALYGFDVEFQVDDKLSMAELESTCKAMIRPRVGVLKQCADGTPPGLRINVTPDSFNRYELGVLEDESHDDDSKMHLLWGTRIGNDEPKTVIDEQLDYDSRPPTGIA